MARGGRHSSRLLHGLGHIVAASGAWHASLTVKGQACPRHGGRAHHHTWPVPAMQEPQEGVRAQQLWRNDQASYLVSSDFCGSGGGPTVGELHLGGICTRNRSHYLETFPLLWTIPPGELHFLPWAQPRWLCQYGCLALSRCQGERSIENLGQPVPPSRAYVHIPAVAS